jgi:diguanylate cyclase
MKQIEKRFRRTAAVFKARELLTAFVLALSLFITYRLWTGAMNTQEQTLETSIDFRSRESMLRIQQRLQVYEQVLRAARGLFAASNDITRGEFHDFVDSLNLAQSYPGIQGLGFAVVVSAAEKQAHVAAVRREGFPDYRIRPPGQREMYTSIVYLEPFAGSNLRAFGYDMYTDPNRRAAMQRARDTGAAAVSAKVTLVQEADANAQAGFLMYLPVYRNGAPHETLPQRRANLVGWVYAPFRMNDFMLGLNGEQGSDLDIEIFDDDTISEATRMYDTEATVDATDARYPLRRITRIEAGDRTWTVAVAALPEFEYKLRSDRPQIILRTGVGISVLLGLLSWLFLDDRARALHAADQALQLSLYDALTGLPNRKLLDERIKQTIAKARRQQGTVALMFIDLDKFKPVNDTYGHAYGDLLLKEVAQRLQNCMRASDTACRLGGDEFVALLSEVDGSEAAMKVATKILNRLTLPYEVVGHVFEISASIGVALYPENGVDGKTLMKSADMAMYEAKNSGRGNVKFACLA